MPKAKSFARRHRQLNTDISCFVALGEFIYLVGRNGQIELPEQSFISLLFSSHVEPGKHTMIPNDVIIDREKFIGPE